MAKRMSRAARKKRRVRVILIVVIVLALIGLGVGVLRDRVTSQVNEGAEAALSAEVSRGSISTTVSGSGNLADEDVEEMKLHSGVEVEEINVEAGDWVEEGDLLAAVNMSTVLTAMSDIQTQLNELDEEIGEASGDELEDSIKTNIGGRIMKIYAEVGDDVSTVMYEKGALALLSLDGYMALELETAALSAGDTVNITGSDDSKTEGTVKSVSEGKALILVPDSDCVYGDTVTVTDSEDAVIGSGELYIHEQMKLTGVAGTVKSIWASEGQKVYANGSIFYLSDTSFSANYTSLLEDRTELEEQLMRLIKVYQDGALLAPMSGMISSLGSDESSSSSTAQMSYSGFSGSGTVSSASTETVEETTVLSICPGTKMTVSISVDESDILSLALGQEAVVAVDALDDESVSATVTEIDTTASSSGGVTRYTVTVSFDKSERMLSGMSASVAIVIEGVDDALLIPAEALTQTSSASYVYTSYNAETGELGGMVEVVAGLNNGSYVEISSGLSEGDTVYYFEEESNSFGFGGGGMNFGGGNMPGGMDFGGGGGNSPGGMDFGGNMPSGGGMNFGGGNAPGGMGGGMPSGFGG